MDPIAIPVGWVDIDKSYDNILSLGMKPFVELSFLPQFVANCSNGPGHPGVRNANGSGVNPQCGAWLGSQNITSRNGGRGGKQWHRPHHDHFCNRRCMI